LILRGTRPDVRLLAGAVDDRRIIFLDDRPPGAAEHVERDVLELDAELLADELAAGEDRDVFEHRLAAIAEAGRLDGGDLQPAAQPIDDQRSQHFALDILGDDQERTSAPYHPPRAAAAAIVGWKASSHG